MLLQQERQLIVKYGKKLLASQLVTGTGGNLSIINRAQNLVAIKPSGVDYTEMQAEDVVVVDLAGRVVDGRLLPSSELQFHLALLQQRPDINAVVHTHQVYATTLACMNLELPAVHYLVGYSGNKVPLAKYATFGSRELAENIVNAIGSYNACLMANHGIVTLGKDIHAAFNVAEELELVAHIYCLGRSMGAPVILPDEEMAVVINKFASYGKQPGR